ncbi:MAG TPA: hypothetical protein VMW66_06170 [Elusimicrobiales bacterium]|nr:hypothetical protein [Elusimicrobiales bacterium]
MKNKKLITLPHNFELREYQKPVWQYMRSGGNRAILIWHRRAGKDIFCHNFNIASAIESVGNYWHIMPYYSQIRKALWEARTADGKSYIDFIPREIIKTIKNQEMAIHLKNGSIIRFLGGDRPNSLVGAAPKGMIISEWALQRPSLWHYLEPILLENKGWAIFNSTPRGTNHAKETYDNFVKDPKTYASLLTIKDTKAITEKQIQEIRMSGTPEEIIQQEYYCSFAGTIQGAYYGDLINQAEKQSKICSVPYDEQALVHTYWDLGIDDMMSIWFIQFIGKEIRIIDYYENHNQRLSFYADLLINSKQYKYGSHNLPHDGNTRELGSGKTRSDMLMEAGLNNVKHHPRNLEPYNGIIKVRALLSRCFFDEKKTKDGVLALKHYHREYDENRKTFKRHPEHDWSSHASDAFRLMAETHSENINRPIQTQTYIAKVGNII